MPAALADHLWQSCLCLVLIAVLNWLLRRQAALVRLWLWRVAALKFLVPFALLHAAGKWLGFPIVHAEDQAPAFLVQLFARLEPWLAPAQTAALEAARSWLLSAFLAASAAAWGVTIARQYRVERLRAHWESVDAQCGLLPRPGMGFFRAALLTTLAMCATAGVMLAGGVEDRQHRHAVLISNALALRQASVVVSIAGPGMGERSRVLADAEGVLIRNANVRDLLAIVYGVSQGSVTVDQMVSSGAAGPSQFWLLAPRYDVRVNGPVREPERFEPYALHQVITRMLAERFSIEVHVNGKCAPPCGRYRVPLSESPL